MIVKAEIRGLFLGQRLLLIPCQSDVESYERNGTTLNDIKGEFVTVVEIDKYDYKYDVKIKAPASKDFFDSIWVNSDSLINIFTNNAVIERII